MGVGWGWDGGDNGSKFIVGGGEDHYMINTTLARERITWPYFWLISSLYIYIAIYNKK